MSPWIWFFLSVFCFILESNDTYHFLTEFSCNERSRTFLKIEKIDVNFIFIKLNFYISPKCMRRIETFMFAARNEITWREYVEREKKITHRILLDFSKYIHDNFLPRNEKRVQFSSHSCKFFTNWILLRMRALPVSTGIVYVWLWQCLCMAYNIYNNIYLHTLTSYLHRVLNGGAFFIVHLV